MDSDQLQELAALYAVGALDGADRDTFQALLEENDPAALAELQRFQSVTAQLAQAAPVRVPPAGIKEKLMQQIAPPARPPELAAEGFRFVFEAEKTPWVSLPVPGARIKLLSRDDTRGFAVVLGQLDPGARYPAHQHIGPEDIYVLSGDLHIGETALRAGDFHHANAGTRHSVNFSETGCTILAVITNQDLMAQLAAAL